MEVLTVLSFKGGVAKTSTSLHMGAALTKFHKKKVLLIDFDPQANLTVGLGLDVDSLKTMVPVLRGELSIPEVICRTYIEGLDIVPANIHLDGLERTHPLVNDPYSHERIRRSLQKVKDDYDFVIIDTPPSFSWLTQSACYASQKALVCSAPEAYSVLALRRLHDFFGGIQQYHPIDVIGVALNFWDPKGAVNESLLNEIDTTFPGKTFDSKIRRDISVSRAVLSGKVVYDYDKDSRAGEDYRNLANELLNRYAVKI